MKVRDMMRSEVLTIRPDAPIAEIAKLMLDEHLSGIPVVNDNGSLVGMVTQRDVVAKHARVHLPTYLEILGSVVPLGNRETERELRRALATTAREIMTRDVITVSPDTDIEDAASLMVERGANPLPVVDGELVGIISHVDVIRLLLLEERDALES